MLRRIGLVSVVCAVALVYGPGLRAPFVFDDLSAIPDNPRLRQLATAFDPPPDTSLTGRPLVHASFALTYALAGLDPAAHRVPNVLLHLLNAFLLLRLLERLLRRRELPDWVQARAGAAAFVIAGLWALHPLQTEAVAYVTQRTELLAATALLAAVSFALTAFERGGDRRYALAACLATALGSGCKETVVVAPALMVCLDRAFFSPSLRAALERHRLLYLGQLLGLAALFLQPLTNPRGPTAGFGLGISPLDNLALQGHAILLYLRLALWPDALTVSYNLPIDRALGRYWPADLAIAAAFALTILGSLQRRRAALLGWFFFALLAPSSSVVPILSEMVAERRMYLALAALLTAAVLLGVRLSRQRALVAALGCGLLAAAYTARSRARVDDYRSSEALYTSALEVAPDNPQAMWGLAQALEARGEHEAARALYERMASQPYPYAGPASWGTRGLIAEADLLARLGRREEAAATRRRALTHDPKSAITRLQHAADALQRGETTTARAELRAMLDQPFLHDRVHLELGLLELRAGNAASATEHLALALELSSDRATIEARIHALAATAKER